MELLYRGKTKDIFLDTEERLLLYFKDSVTGTGEVLDPGGNEVVGRIAGKGSTSLHLSIYFFTLLEQAGVATHFLGRGREDKCLQVKRANSFWRYRVGKNLYNGKCYCKG